MSHGGRGSSIETNQLSSELVGFFVATLAFGAAFGVLAVSVGMGIGITVLASAAIFSGGAQFGALGVLSAGGTSGTAIATGILLNLRFAAMALSLSQRLRMSVRARFAAAVIMIDVPLLLALREEDDDRVDRIYWISGVVIFSAWVGGTLLGASVGSVLGDPNALGFDAALPAMFVALLYPTLKGREEVAAAASGFIIALALMPLTPPGIPVIAAVLGAVVPLLLWRNSTCRG